MAKTMPLTVLLGATSGGSARAAEDEPELGPRQLTIMNAPNRYAAVLPVVRMVAKRRHSSRRMRPIMFDLVEAVVIPAASSCGGPAPPATPSHSPPSHRKKEVAQKNVVFLRIDTGADWTFLQYDLLEKLYGKHLCPIPGSTFDAKAIASKEQFALFHVTLVIRESKDSFLKDGRDRPVTFVLVDLPVASARSCTRNVLGLDAVQAIGAYVRFGERDSGAYLVHPGLAHVDDNHQCTSPRTLDRIRHFLLKAPDVTVECAAATPPAPPDLQD